MSRLQRLTDRLPNWLLITIGGIAGLLIVFNLLRLTSVFHGTANKLVAQADSETGSRVASDYQLAIFFNPSDHGIVHKLADYWVKQNNPDEAIRTLKLLPVGESGVQIARLQRQTGQLDLALGTIDLTIIKKSTAEAQTERSRILLEKGNNDAAVDGAFEAVRLAPTDETNLQLGLAYLVADKTESVQNFLSSLKPSATLESLQKAQQGKYQLASVLYSGGLVRSAERVLIANQPQVAPDYRLLGQIEADLAANEADRWDKARDYLEKAVVADPANLVGHQLLKKAYLKLDQSDKADAQQKLIDQLESGKV